jgi:RNA polymerase sigma factor for flagellar operon FliA
MQVAYATQSCHPGNDREALILEHLPQVRWIAASFHERLPLTVLEEDLVSAGIVGLIAAVDKFDPSRNTSLRTYAEHKIRGAILDSIRGLDGIASHHRKRAKQVQAAIDTAEQKLHRAPTEEEIAADLGISTAEYQQTLLDVRGVTLGALESVNSEGASANLLRYIADREETSPGWIMERRSLEQLLVQALKNMPRIERTIISLYFMEQLTLTEIGRVLDLHNSRVCQLKQQAILRLRTMMQKQWPGRMAANG